MYKKSYLTQTSCKIRAEATIPKASRSIYSLPHFLLMDYSTSQLFCAKENREKNKHAHFPCISNRQQRNTESLVDFLRFSTGLDCWIWPGKGAVTLQVAFHRLPFIFILHITNHYVCVYVYAYTQVLSNPLIAINLI